ncbi:MAG: hypothetical protein SGI71_00500 [Verrucomicrobiota bacterium]|nr:hypothetical protein [Verrucomicrobiota bacterium]
MTFLIIGDETQNLPALKERTRDASIKLEVNIDLPTDYIAILAVSVAEGLSSGTFKALEKYSDKILYLSAILLTDIDDKTSQETITEATDELKSMLPNLISQQANDLPIFKINSQDLFSQLDALAKETSRSVAAFTPAKVTKNKKSWWKL